MNAAFRQLCLSRTREDMLQRISDWILNVDDQEPNVLWLHGLAGSGKSTIAATISKQFGSIPSQRSGAFLFFERERSVRESVVRTIAAQLASSNHILRLEISESINKYGEDIVRRDVDVQFEHLINIPLQKASERLGGPLLIVIDALDEYGDEYARRHLLELIVTKLTKLPPCSKVLVTSRPETDIVARLSNNPNIKTVPLDAGEDTIPAIRLYLAFEMDSIHRNKQMDSVWPIQADLDRISTMSGGLFVWASTLSRLLHTSPNPTKRLDQILSLDGSTFHRGLDALYENVLSTQLGWEDEHDIVQFREVAGVILFCKIPLSDVLIDQLLGRPAEDSCRRIFLQLGSVFDFTPGWPIRPVHASFRDYLTDERRSEGKPWSLVGFDAYYHIAERCFTLMFKQLRFNICDFISSYDKNENCPNMEQKIATNIPPSLHYACRYGLEHLLEIDESRFPNDLEGILETFLGKKLLSWAEVLSVTGDGWYIDSALKRHNIRHVPFVGLPSMFSFRVTKY